MNTKLLTALNTDSLSYVTYWMRTCLHPSDQTLLAGVWLQLFIISENSLLFQ